MDFLQEYAELINLGLFGIIIGWLFHISRLSRTSLIDQYNAKLAVKDQQIVTLQSQLDVKQAQYENQLAVVEHSRAFFERLATLQGDERVNAVKLEYEMRMEALQKREATVELDIQSGVRTRTAELDAEIESLRAEREALETEARKLVSIDKETLSTVVDVASKVLRLLT